jgi:PAS domain S-box-containing protein
MAEEGRQPGRESSRADLAQRLHEVEDRFRLFMENVREYAVFMLDPEGRVTDWNLGAEHVLGYGNEILGQPFGVFFPPDDVRNGVPERELRRAVETGQASDDRWHVRKDGTYFWALGITTAMRDPQGALKGFTKILRDSTERKRFEEQLDQRNQALQEADRRKDEFLAVLAHELRNPLAPIFNALSILEDERVPAEAQRNARRVIARQVRSLARLIDDLLDVSRITRNKIQLRKATVRLQTAVENAVQTCRPLAQPRNQQLEVSMPPEAVFVDGDQTRLEQVLVNLLGNAAKYRGDGSTVQVVLASGQGKAQIRVKDNGVGIAPDVLPRVFDLFTQADASLERSQGGLGVGLTLVKRLVELHDGAVEAHSAGLGQGAEFVVSLPLLPAQPASTPVEKQIEPPRESSTPLRILVVDDNIDAAHSLQLLLELSGHHVSTVHSGLETLEAARAYKPDVILLDIALPGLNGYQVAERLRATPDTQNVVLVATTGYGQDEDRARAAQSGFDHHLVKPIDPDVLAGLLTAIAVRIKASGNAGNAGNAGS